MLDTLNIKRFTTFSVVRSDFVPGVNVVIGETGAGKSHLLKLAYALSAVKYAAGKGQTASPKAQWQKAIAAKLSGVFRPDRLGRLVRSHRACGAQVGRCVSEIDLELSGAGAPRVFSFPSVAQVEVKLRRDLAQQPRTPQ